MINHIDHKKWYRRNGCSFFNLDPPKRSKASDSRWKAAWASVKLPCLQWCFNLKRGHFSVRWHRLEKHMIGKSPFQTRPTLSRSGFLSGWSARESWHGFQGYDNSPVEVGNTGLAFVNTLNVKKHANKIKSNRFVLRPNPRFKGLSSDSQKFYCILQGCNSAKSMKLLVLLDLLAVKTF